MAKPNAADEIAFKNFKKSITKEEFEAVLKMAKEEYKKVKEVLVSANKFADKAAEGMFDAGENGDDNSAPPDFAKKLIAGLTRKANEQVVELFGDQILRSNTVVDFINRFKKPGKELEYLNFTLLDEAFKKDQKDGKKEKK
tara:strand:+ start:172 stop:594 length:423 start_codon:yes stop_codon:yes gene_type:complete